MSNTSHASRASLSNLDVKSLQRSTVGLRFGRKMREKLEAAKKEKEVSMAEYNKFCKDTVKRVNTLDQRRTKELAVKVMRTM